MKPSHPTVQAYALATIIILALGTVANAQDDEFEPVDLHDDIAERVEGLDQEKIDFLRGEDALNFAERHDILFSRLGNKSPEAIEAYIDAMMPEDLVAGNVEVAIMGIGMDTGTGYRRAAYAPMAVRSGRVYLGTGFVNMPDMHAMVSAFNELTIVDYGDIAVDHLSLERSLEHIISKVHEVAAAGAFPIVRRLCAEKNVVGYKLVELNPLVDPGYTSAQNADRVLQECLTGIAMRKRGLTEPHYLSPLMVDHGHDQ